MPPARTAPSSTSSAVAISRTRVASFIRTRRLRSYVMIFCGGCTPGAAGGLRLASSTGRTNRGRPGGAGSTNSSPPTCGGPGTATSTTSSVSSGPRGHDHHQQVLRSHLYEEQGGVLQDRLVRPDKRWKLNRSDFTERKRWNDYATAYTKALERTSTEMAPWYVIASIASGSANWAVSKILVDALDGSGSGAIRSRPRCRTSRSIDVGALGVAADPDGEPPGHPLEHQADDGACPGHELVEGPAPVTTGPGRPSVRSSSRAERRTGRPLTPMYRGMGGIPRHHSSLLPDRSQREASEGADAVGLGLAGAPGERCGSSMTTPSTAPPRDEGPDDSTAPPIGPSM